MKRLQTCESGFEPMKAADIGYIRLKGEISITFKASGTRTDKVSGSVTDDVVSGQYN